MIRFRYIRSLMHFLTCVVCYLDGDSLDLPTKDECMYNNIMQMHYCVMKRTVESNVHSQV